MSSNRFGCLENIDFTMLYHLFDACIGCTIYSSSASSITNNIKNASERKQINDDNNNNNKLESSQWHVNERNPNKADAWKCSTPAKKNQVLKKIISLTVKRRRQVHNQFLHANSPPCSLKQPTNLWMLAPENVYVCVFSI